MPNFNVIDTLVTRLQFQGSAEFARQILGLGKSFDGLENNLAKAQATLANVGDAPQLQSLNRQLFQLKSSMAQLEMGGGFDKIQQKLGLARLKLNEMQNVLAITPAGPEFDALEAQTKRQANRVMMIESELGNARLSQKVMLNNKLLANESTYNREFLAMTEARNAKVLLAEEELAAARATLQRQLILGGTLLGVTFLTGIEMGAVKAATEFQTLRLELETLYGSAKKGDQAFDWAKNFAVRTPFQIEDTVKALKFMVADGINPTEQRMRDLGGMAKIFEKDFSDAVKAVNQGAQGHFRRLQDSFGGINKEMVNRIAGKEIFDQAGHSVRSYSETVDALFQVIHSKYGPAIKDLEGSTATALSNVKDAWKNFLATVGDGQLGVVKDTAMLLTETLTLMTKGVLYASNAWTIFSLAIQEAYLGMLKIESASKATQTSDFFRKMFGAPTMDDKIKGEEKRIAELKNTMWGTANKILKFDEKGNLPPLTPGQMGAGEGSGSGSAEKLIQAIIGGGQIAQRGIKETELPGMNVRIHDHTYHVKVDGANGRNFETWLQTEFQNFLNQTAKQGGFQPQYAQ